jgi:uncharacterized protein YndB with AHSA1/START domain
MTDKVLRMTRRFDVPPEKVFDAWTDSRLTRLWLFTSIQSEKNVTEIDVRVGGKWKMTDTRGGTDYTAVGEYLEVDRPRKLVFTFGMPQFGPNFDTITVELEAVGAGTLMTFIQSGKDIAEEVAKVPAGEMGGSETGWHYMFLGLAEIVQNRIPIPPPMPHVPG